MKPSMPASIPDFRKQETAIAQISNSVEPDFSSIGARIYMWGRTWELIKQRPFFGWGPGSYKVKWCEQVNYPVGAILLSANTRTTNT